MKKGTYPRTPEIKEKMRLAQTGKTHSKETLLKMKIFKLANPIRYWLGKIKPPVSDEVRKKLGQHWMGSKNPGWKGGVSLINHSLRKNLMNGYLYKKWRRDIYTRDNHTCQMCLQQGGTLNADHIIKFETIITKYNIKTIAEANKCTPLWDIFNGRTLCSECHRGTKTYGSRNKKELQYGCYPITMNLSI